MFLKRIGKICVFQIFLLPLHRELKTTSNNDLKQYWIMFGAAMLTIAIILTWYLWNDDDDDNRPRFA